MATSEAVQTVLMAGEKLKSEEMKLDSSNAGTISWYMDGPSQIRSRLDKRLGQDSLRPFGPS